MNSITKKISWWIFGIFSLLIGFYPLTYFVVDRRFGLLPSKTPELLANEIWNIGFYGHILFGGLALAIGWIQFNKSLRQKNLSLHRRIGKIYVIAVLVSSICGVYIGFFATGGWVSAVGFIALGIIWFLTTTSAFLFIKKGEISKHQKMMIYSYAACFGAVTLRIWLPILIAIMGEFNSAYRIVAWLSWVPNMIIAYFIVKRIGKIKPESVVG